MDEEIRNLLDEEIKAQIKGLSSLKSGSAEKSKATEDLAELYRLRVEETKSERSSGEEIMRRKNDEELRRDQLAEQVKDRYFKLGIATAELVLPLIFYATWMRKGFEFEKEGAYTSVTFRGLINRFRPTKK